MCNKTLGLLKAFDESIGLWVRLYPGFEETVHDSSVAAGESLKSERVSPEYRS